MGFDDNKSKNNSVDKTPNENEEIVHQVTGENIPRTFSESPASATKEDDDEEGKNIDLGPQYTIKQQFEKDKGDESLRRWKEQLLGSVDFDSVGESLDPEVKILSLTIKSPGKPDVLLSIPENGKPNGPWFTLKEGSRYSLNFSFQVKNNIVTGLNYTNAVWKVGVKVDSTKEMIGTFSPQLEPYTHEMPEDTTPSGFLARGSYLARTKFLDDDNMLPGDQLHI